MSWQSLTTRRGNRPKFYGGPTRGRPKGKIMPKTRKDAEQDKRIDNVKRSVAKINKDTEVKFKDTEGDFAWIPNGQLTLLNGVNQGDTVITREGNQFYMTSLQWRILMQTDADQVGPTVIRMILFLDMQANGGLPTVSGVTNTQGLLDTSVIGETWLAPYNKNNLTRYKILYDKTWNMNPIMAATTTLAGAVTTVTTYNVLGKILHGKIKINKKAQLNDPGTGIAQINTNALWVLQISDDVANPPTSQGGYRLYYKDL